MLSKINWTVIRALIKRDLLMYFSNPAGYVFITLFIFLSAAAAFWQPQFFANNLANLDQLNNLFPYLLLFFVPALTMSVWADERKQGTDELLLTLPATDLEIVLGKYLATLGVYTASLLLSLSHVLVLFWLGSPDLGLMLANYLGYWLIGAAFIAVGMLASLLTPNVTVAFIVGAAFCSIFVFIDVLGGLVSEGLGRFLAPLGVFGHFGDFTNGVISFSGLFYFVSMTAVMITINVLLVGRRHWPREADGYPMWVHHLVRTVALTVLIVGLNAIISRAGLRLDTTAERLHSMSSETRKLLSEIPSDKPVFIQAYISPEVPEPYVQTRENILGTLRDLEAEGGGRVQVVVRDTEPFSPEAGDARERFGITARQIPNLGSARASISNVFLGLAFTSGAEEEVIPFFDRGLPVEYELVRSIRMVARTDRKKIGVVNTSVKLFGGMDFQTFRSQPPWSVVEELKKQYEVIEVNPGAPIDQDVDGLLVVLPSSLSQPEMDTVMGVVESGTPALFLVDPLPVIDPSQSPSETPGANANPFMRQNQPPPKTKGDVRLMLTKLGDQWDSTAIIWDEYNPHPDLAGLPPEVVFVGHGNGNPEAFNENDLITAGLQQVVLLYPGSLRPDPARQYEFQPLLQTGRLSGRLPYFQMVQRSFFGAQINRNLPHRPGGEEFVVAAWIKSPGQEDTGGAAPESAEGEEPPTPAAKLPKINAIVVSDIDFVSEQFFQIRSAGPANLNFDNVTFFLNCMDKLVGDESFVELRKRRVRHRTLARVEEQTRQFIQTRSQDEEAAEQEAEAALAEAQSRLNEKVEAVRNRQDLDGQAKQQMVRNLQEAENRRFNVLKANIERGKELQIQESKERMESQIRRIQNNMRTFAVMLPPIPVFVLGVWVFIRRRRREHEGTAAARRLRG